MRRRPSGNAGPACGYCWLPWHAPGASTRGADAGRAALSQLWLARWQTVDMPQTYWLDLFTVETWKEFLDHGGDVTGFREKRWKTVQKIKHGDYLLCYLTGASRWVGLPGSSQRACLRRDPYLEVRYFPSRGSSTSSAPAAA
jgi:hypothetical protein